jgi:Tol biopolymer transport system component
MITTTRGLTGLAFACGLLFLALATSAAQAKTQIVWSSVDSDFSRQRLVIAQADGSDRHDLTDPAAKHTNDIDAQISPDGTQVVFGRDLRNGKVSQAVLIGADGQNERVLDLGCVDPCVVAANPTWAPGGQRLAFTRVVGPFDVPPSHSARSAVLWSSSLDGSGLERISQPGIDGVLEDSYPRYSPDGSYIVFTRLRISSDTVAAFRMDADGTDVRRLTPWRLQADLADLSPATSGPTKDLVAFETYGHGETPEGKSQNIATVPSTCTSVSDCREQTRYLTDHHGGAGAAFNPSWSPNGRRIAYTKFSNENDDHPCCIGDIYTMRPDGSARRPVSTSPKFEYRPDWGTVP